jgi:hypothetical protein
MSNESHPHPVTSGLPSTLAEWRGYSVFPIGALWDPLRPWFLLHGLHIFNKQVNYGSPMVHPQVNEIRAYDGTYSTHFAPPDIPHDQLVR